MGTLCWRDLCLWPLLRMGLENRGTQGCTAHIAALAVEGIAVNKAFDYDLRTSHCPSQQRSFPLHLISGAMGSMCRSV